MSEPVNIEKKYRIGELDQRVQILSPTEVQSSTNYEVTVTWGEYATRFASVTPLGGSESIISDALHPTSRARFVFRYDANISEKCRLVWKSRTYNIQSIEVVPRDRFLIIMAESNDTIGGSAVDYGDYYATNSLKIRTVTGTYVLAVTDALITTAVGLTAAQAGVGYTCFGAFTKTLNPTLYYLIVSNGTSWFTSDMAIRP
jgi:head-tail adaptor